MQKTGLLIASFGLIWLVLAGAVPAQANSDQPGCWIDYAECAQQSGGDENWRSICYADFSQCIGKKPLPECPSKGRLKTCIDYAVQCRSVLAGDDAWAAQCADDQDACELAHGC